MIKTSDVKDWLKAMFPDVPQWYAGAMDKDKPQVIGVYARSNGRIQPQAVGTLSTYGIKSISLLIHWGNAATPCEEQAIRIYERLRQCNHEELIGGRRCWIDIRRAPISIGRDAKGMHECVLDFDILYRRINE